MPESLQKQDGCHGHAAKCLSLLKTRAATGAGPASAVYNCAVDLAQDEAESGGPQGGAVGICLSASYLRKNNSTEPLVCSQVATARSASPSPSRFPAVKAMAPGTVTPVVLSVAKLPGIG